MDKPSLKELLKNPANVILLFIFLISVVVGSLFIFRIFYHKADNTTIAMKELDDSLIYYISTSQLDNNGSEAKKVALILDGKNQFNFILNDNQTTGYTGTYVINDNTIKLFTDTYYSGKSRNEYKLFTLTTLDDGSLVLNNSINNVSNYKFNKVNSNMFKSSGYNKLTVENNQTKYTYKDSDNESISSGTYTLNSPYLVMKYIDRINEFYSDSFASSIYNVHLLSRRYINSSQILSFILPNIDINTVTGDILNTISNSLFYFNLYFDNIPEINYKGNKYLFMDNKYVNTKEVTGEKYNNIIKRVYNYEIIDQKLVIDEIVIAYECSNGVCKYYPVTDLTSDVKNYYDFTTSSINIDKILYNIDKINHYTWTFVLNGDSYLFESIELN